MHCIKSTWRGKIRIMLLAAADKPRHAGHDIEYAFFIRWKSIVGLDVDALYPAADKPRHAGHDISSISAKKLMVLIWCQPKLQVSLDVLLEGNINFKMIGVVFVLMLQLKTSSQPWENSNCSFCSCWPFMLCRLVRSRYDIEQHSVLCGGRLALLDWSYLSTTALTRARH